MLTQAMMSLIASLGLHVSAFDHATSPVALRYYGLLTWKDLSSEKGWEVMYCDPMAAATNLDRAAVSLSGRRALIMTRRSSSGMRFHSPAEILVSMLELAPVPFGGR